MKLLAPAFFFYPGKTPLLISIPHCGTTMPQEHRALLAPEAQLLPDTDWHLERLYAFAKDIGAGLLIAQYSRFLIDLNRPHDDKPLYPGATTGLFPETLFDGTRIYRQPPPPQWQKTYLRYLWQTYHIRIQRELDYLRHQFGHAILFDAHSIRSRIPRLFDGELPHFSLGTNDGASCDPTLAEGLLSILEAEKSHQAVFNGRFKGGYITRHYGQPARKIHAIQLEMAQRCYMREEPPFEYDEQRAANLKVMLSALLTYLARYEPI